MLKQRPSMDKFTWYMISAALLFLAAWTFTKINSNLHVALAFVIVIIVHWYTKDEKIVDDNVDTPQVAR